MPSWNAKRNWFKIGDQSAMRPDHTEWLVNLKVSVRRAVIRAGREAHATAETLAETELYCTGKSEEIHGVETGTETLLRDGNDQFIDASTGGHTMAE